MTNGISHSQSRDSLLKLCSTYDQLPCSFVFVHGFIDAFYRSSVFRVWPLLERPRISFRRQSAWRCLRHLFNLAQPARLVMKRASFFVICFCSLLLFFSLALSVHKTQKVLKCKWTTNQLKHLGSHVKQNNVHGRDLFNIKQSSLKSVELPSQLVLSTMCKLRRPWKW